MTTLMKFRKRRSSLGLSLVEALLSVAIFSTIGIFTDTVLLLTARESKSAISEIPTERQIYDATDFVRRQLLPARAPSVSVSGDQRTVTFVNPSIGTTSQITFTNDGNFFFGRFDPDIDTADDEQRFGRNLAGSFRRVTDKQIELQVSAKAWDQYDDLKTFDYTVLFTFRN